MTHNWPGAGAFLVRAWEDTTDQVICRSYAEVRQAYIDLCVGSIDRREQQEEVEQLMIDFHDPDHWCNNGTRFRREIGECAYFEVTKLPAEPDDTLGLPACEGGDLMESETVAAMDEVIAELRGKP